MNVAQLLQWNYLIFVLPFGVSSFLLLLSSARLGHHGGHGHHGAAPGGTHYHFNLHLHRHEAPVAPSQSHAPAHAQPAHPNNHHAPPRHDARSDSAKHDQRTENQPAPVVSVIVGLIGVGRAPLPMIVEAFGIAWGFTGLCADQLLLHGAKPSPGQILLPLGIALVGGLLGARFAAELIARIMPPEESLVVSQDALFGLSGSIAFPVSETSGRIHIYDEFGTLHDEMCRVEVGHPPIEKGRRALVVDRNAQGNLIVEEVPAQVR